MASSRRHLVGLTLIAWLAMLGFDFFLHAGVLAGLYLAPSPFLLPPAAAFARIPAGYASFLLIAGLLVWLMLRLRVRGWRAGAFFGLQLGGLLWGALVLGLLSISTASLNLLACWWAGQTLELGLAGGLAGSGLAGARLGRLLGLALAVVVVAVGVTIALQSLGVAAGFRV